MAAVFTMIWLVVLAGLVASVVGVVRSRTDKNAYARWLVSVVAVFTILLIYLVVKFVYEEIIPCMSIDDRYCDFGSTQYRNLFGWEF